NDQELVLAYHDRSDGGLFVTVVEMEFAGHLRVKLDIPDIVKNGDFIRSLFNEELGVIIQIRKNYLGKIIEIFTKSNFPRNHIYCVETSFQIQSLCDNSICAKEEFDNILYVNNPDLHFHLTFDPTEDVTLPFVKSPTTLKPKIAILQEQGVNGHMEMAFTFYFQDSNQLMEFENFFKKRNDTFTLGICNGCQFLSQLKEIIPGTEYWPIFKRNRSEQFEARFSLVEITSHTSSSSLNSLSDKPDRNHHHRHNLQPIQQQQPQLQCGNDERVIEGGVFDANNIGSGNVVAGDEERFKAFQNRRNIESFMDIDDDDEEWQEQQKVQSALSAYYTFKNFDDTSFFNETIGIIIGIWNIVKGVVAVGGLYGGIT
ncbi:13515_t:CDS:2, partial [Entrophospora sp. SA101]